MEDASMHAVQGREERLAAMMRESAGGIQPPTAALVAGGVARGRRMRAARRVQISLAGIGVIALGLVGIVLPDHAGPKTSVAATPAQTDASSPQALVETPLTGKTALAVLKGLLAPQALVVSEHAAGPDLNERGDRTASAYVVLNPDNLGPGLVSLMISGSAQFSACPAQQDLDAGATCTTENLPDGSKLRLETGREMPPGSDKANPALWSAHLVRTDGVGIYISASNAEAEKTAPTRLDPVLTMAELRKIATAPSWQTIATPETVAQAPTPAAGNRPEQTKKP